MLALTFVFLIVACWVFFYIQSWYQRRKAEALIKELRTFPFASATFDQVRNLTLRYGGSPIPVYQFPAAPRKVACSTQNCRFLISIGSGGLLQFRLAGKAADFAYAEAHLLGIRWWGVTANFTIYANKLQSSSLFVGEFREGQCVTTNDLILWTYEAESRKYAPDQPYSVGFTHVTGQPSYNFGASFVPEAGPPPQWIFDINLDCLTTPFRDCRDMGELAPSAWARYRAELTSPDDFQCY